MKNNNCDDQNCYNRTVQVIEKEGRHQDFNDHWRFQFGDFDQLFCPDFDDSNWEEVNLPHDFSINQPYTANAEAESAYKLGGVGWYRKTFLVDQHLSGSDFSIECDGSYMETEVYVNGHYIGKHLNGYLAFSYQISDFINFGGENTIAIRVENKIPSSRWYSGSGLYRPVSLSVLAKVHFIENSCRILWQNSQDYVSQKDRNLQCDLFFQIAKLPAESSKLELLVSVKESLYSEKRDKLILQDYKLSLNRLQEKKTCQVNLDLGSVKLWSPDQPYLYTFELQLRDSKRVYDCIKVETGFRKLDYSSERGLYLNGQALKLKGVCLHHDQGGLGACAYKNAFERQLELLKKMGANAIRIAHNPAARQMKKLAAQLGFLILEEAFDTWSYPKNGNDKDFSKYFHQQLSPRDSQYLEAKVAAETTWGQYCLQNMIIQGITNPAIIGWSIGNELFEGISGDPSHYPQLAEKLIKCAEEIDGSRFLTIGDNKIKDTSFCWHKEISAIFEKLSQSKQVQGMVGLNYAKGKEYDRLHKEHPKWFLYGSETASAVNSRSVYIEPDKEDGSQYELTSYDLSTVAWGAYASQAWFDVISRDFIAGEFVWTGFDYLGEPTPWNNISPGVTASWPSPKHSYFGIIDTAGFPKDSYYFYQSQWAEHINTLHILPVWDDKVVQLQEDNLVQVHVYSNASSVQLIFEDERGRQIDYGRKYFTKVKTASGHSYQVHVEDSSSELQADSLYLSWQIPYQRGKLLAYAYDHLGRLISETSGRKEVSHFESVDHLELLTYKDYQSQEDQLLYLTVNLCDCDKKLVISADNLIEAELSGPAKLLALDNANPTDHSLYNVCKKRAYKGKLLLIIQLSGQAGLVELKLKSPGLEGISYQLKVESPLAAKASVCAYPVHHHYDFKGERSYLDPLAQSPKEKAGAYKQISTYDQPKTYYHQIDSLQKTYQSTLWLKDYEEPILPKYFQPQSKDAGKLGLILPIIWEERSGQDTVAVYQGRAQFLGEELALELAVKRQKEVKVLDRDISSLAKKEVRKVKEQIYVLSYRYDTVQSIGAIGLKDNDYLKEKEVTLRLYLAEQVKGQEMTILASAFNQELIYQFEETYPALIIEIELSSKEEPDSNHFSLWTLKEK
ncbi:sugar-binding domain-containing protein [Streptococcus catagoni]